MNKDLFDYVINPTAKEYKKSNIVDRIAWIPKLEISHGILFKANKEEFINDAIINYNNEVVMVKNFYATMLKYRKYFLRRTNQEYDIWTRKYAEQIIKELFSVYDKSFHIINYLYDFKVTPDINFKVNIKECLKKNDKLFYKKINSVSSRLCSDNFMNGIRDDVTHNFSSLFLKYNPIYSGNAIVSWAEVKTLSYDEYKNIIDNICELLAEQRNLIVNKIAEFYSKK